MLKIGTRIRLLEMENDPRPIPRGSVGTVVGGNRVHIGPGNSYTEIDVNWDNGRKLSLCVPPDRFEIITVKERGKATHAR